MHKIVNNLIHIENQLKDIQSNNLIQNIKIIAVSKTFAIEHVRPLIEYGHMHYGENKIQEAIEKWSIEKKNNSNLKLHMLGKIQSNKVKFLLPLFDYLHSLDNEKVAEKISIEEKKKNKKLKIFIQVNIGDEAQKNGISIKEVKNFYLKCTKEFNLNIIGLMCLPPQSNDPREYFELLSDISKNINLKELSMGMSGDYIDAIKCGATYIRIGSNIFGNRF